MLNRDFETPISLLKNFPENRAAVIAYTVDGNGSHSAERGSPNPFIHHLLSLPVTTLSTFNDPEWDFNTDVINPARNVKGAKLKIDFSKYVNIPPFVMVEIKCLLFYVHLTPLSFAKKGTKRSGQSAVKKPNTIIANFESGLRFFEHLFGKLRKEDAEFVDHRFRALEDILHHDFEDAARDFPYTVDGSLWKFFFYLKHGRAKDVLDTKIEVDFDSLPWPQRTKTKRKEPLIFSNTDFERLALHASSRVVEFLALMNADIADQRMIARISHSPTFKPLILTPKILNDYGVIRLKAKGYTKKEIQNSFQIRDDFCDEKGDIFYHEKLRDIVKASSEVTNFNVIRRQVNEVYYAAQFLVGIYTGMRPSALSEIRLTGDCIVNSEGVDLLCSEEKKGKELSLNLFDDKWVAIPIVRDAVSAAMTLSRLKANDYLYSNMDTVPAGSEMTNMNSTGIKHSLENYLSIVLGQERAREIKVNAYMMRHTLAYQLYRADLGLPFISFQLKHIVDDAGKYTSTGSASATTLGYGEIAKKLTSDSSTDKAIRGLAEIERVKAVMDPDGTYLGPKGREHQERLKKAFEGYMAAGYSKEDVFLKMAEQGLAVINVGTGFCHGGNEDFDESLPCIGTLRCNPIRCSNAVVTKANAPKWREVYFNNKALLGKDSHQDRQDQIRAAMLEAEAVLKDLGEELVT